ncbi:outer dense fiber protein 3B [Cuculus canorus]|uniref:outer dense fiber protein 3B n=1 Tax=Cuculus canorus TaxID=55661 RepID=UPI0023AB0649|nr:outer dense fiber protein 3B [Cuculus canorus]XP_053940546.1 outer dense fiber protein 3B [Cuculus canorus]
MAAQPWVGPWRPHRPRGPIAALHAAPGPKYGLPSGVGWNLHDPSRPRAPAYSFGRRTPGVAQQLSPGPAYLLPPGTTARGKDGTPAFSIHGRPRDLLLFQTPGPGRYSPERATAIAFRRAPSCTMGARGRAGGTSTTPGPAAYRLPPMLGPHMVNKPSAPNFSILGRSTVGAFDRDHSKTPGPCGYDPVAADVYKRRSPHFSILGRTPQPGDPNTKPAPNAYSPQQPRQPRGPTFGVRHSPFVTPLIPDGID